MRRRARRLPRPGCPGSGEEAAAMSKKRLQQLVESLSRSAKHFNRDEVECLIRLFDTLMSASHSRFAAVGFDRNVFRDTLHRAFGMTDDVLMDRVFRTFDRDNDNFISVMEWVEGLSVFLRGTLEERIKYCFEVYDLNGDGYISREEMFQMLKNSLLKQPSEEDPDEGIKDLVDIALKKMEYSAVGSGQAVAYSIMCCYVYTLKKTWQKYAYNKTTHIKYFKDDHDHDGKLSFADFEEAVKNENLLLEAFGPCLPDVKSRMAFERRTFQEKRKP